MNEYSVTWPLWDEHGMCEDGVPHLPDKTARRLRSWTENFNEHFDWDGGWPNSDMAEAHRQQANELLAELQQALGPGAVRLEIWETSFGGRSASPPRETLGHRIRRWLTRPAPTDIDPR
jgi:hypothetical protein